MLLTKNIVFIHWFSPNRLFKCKKTKTFGLALLTHNLGRVGRFCSPTLPYQRTNRYAVVGITSFSYPKLA